MTAPEAKPTSVEPAKKALTAREKVKLNQVTINDPLLGQVIGGHYEVLQCIGKGGMSVVYKTRHQLINQFRAVKVLLPHRDNESDCLLRFQLEATAASKLDNKHIVRVHDFVSPESTAPYMVMDYVEGQGLGDEIDKLGRIPVKRTLYIFVQILEAIGHTHKRGVIHRDLKPDNILLVDDEVEGPDFVKLIDFGIAKLTAADKLQPQGLTPTGEVFGSPQYMSPEQCAGLTMDVRSEIYSLGCILYEMLSGKAPLLGKSVLETLSMQAHTPATPLSKLTIDPPVKVPKNIDDVVMKCLAKKPEDRFQTTDELAKALTKVPSFDRRQTTASTSLPLPLAAAVPVATLLLLLSFSLGFVLAKIAPESPPSEPGKVEAGGGSNAIDETTQWQKLYQGGQKAIDDGDITAASKQLEEALSKANAINDGQIRSAATATDLAAVGVIKQFKTIALTDVLSPVALSDNYSNHPWETKINTLSELLRSNPTGEDEEKAILRPTIELLEDIHKGNLTLLNGVIKLAKEKLPTYAALTSRDKMRLALLIAAVEEEQGYSAKASTELAACASDLDKLGSFDNLAARFYLLQSRLALDEHQLDAAEKAGLKALDIYQENITEHSEDLIEVRLLRSEIALAQGKRPRAYELARHALDSIEKSAKTSEHAQFLKDKLMLKLALINPSSYLEAALSQSQTDLANQETLAPKELPHLITSLEVADWLGKIKEVNANNTARPKLWRAMALAFASGRLAKASALMQPLMVTNDTTFTQKDLLKLASTKLTIDQALSAAGNHNGADLLEDYVTMGKALEDFSLGTARNLQKAKYCLDKATVLTQEPENRDNHLMVARVCYYQARCAKERKDMPTLVELLLRRAESELLSVQFNSIDRLQERNAVNDLKKKIAELQHETNRINGQ